MNIRVYLYTNFQVILAASTYKITLKLRALKRAHQMTMIVICDFKFFFRTYKGSYRYFAFI